MKVSIITVTCNSATTLRDTIESVLGQDYPDIEHIIVDGASTDGTIELVKSYGDQIAQFISEPDHGMYDAMNKGICRSTGDVIGILNSDDFYADADIISTVVQQLKAADTDLVYGDLVYFDAQNPARITRYYSSANFHPRLFAYGWMPAHPTVFIKRWVYSQYGLFKVDYKIASDYELLTRFLAKHRLSYRYIPRIMVRMRTGGASTQNLLSNWILNREIVRGCAENGIQTNLLKVFSKYFTKIWQLVQRPDAAVLRATSPQVPLK